MSKSKFYDKICVAREEREVDAVYTQGLNTYFKNVPITHPYKCDSYLETTTASGKSLHLLVEYKYDENFASQVGVAKVLVQVVFYLKQFELDGKQLPNVVLVGDINECFVPQTNVLQSYLDTPDINWADAPSEAWKNYPQLTSAIANDTQITPFVYHINEDFSFKYVAERIVDQADNVQRFVRVTEHNIANIYEYFCNRVLKDAKKIAPNELVAVFMGTILDKVNFYTHPNKPQILVANNQHIDIDPKAFKAFFSVFDREYNLEERRRFAEISDRLIEETKRRRSGEFYTPTPFVDYAHQMLSEQLGENWRDEYVVWDCCWGTGNLTRDYRFKELYASTLEQAELTIGEHYNKEATKFVFDFLNDPIEGDLTGKTGVPQGLRDALQNDKPILFFINPPYARNSGDNNVGTSDEVCFTMVREVMNNCNMGVCVSNMYAQFLYRILMLKKQFNLSNICLGFFSPTLYLSGESWKHFRADFMNNFEFCKACTFKASYFADVADSWGIAFSVWKNGITQDQTTFSHTMIDLEEGVVVPTGNKNIYNVDDAKTASVWLREETKSLKTYESIELTSAIKVREKDGARQGRIVKDALGYFYNKSNNVDKNTMGIALFSAAFSDNVGSSIIRDNFHKCTTLFAARKLIDKNWINSKDEYLAPNESHPLWQEFVADSLIYSLFHSSSNQSSLRQVEYKGKLWDIRNEFFFMSKNEIERLASDSNYYDTYEDVHTDHERFVYQLLALLEGTPDENFMQSLPASTLAALPGFLSQEAQAVLNKARDITRKTWNMRVLFNDEHPEYQILNWDCGWYQIKALAKEYAAKDLEEFGILYKTLADKMRPMVYKLGFLK